MNSFLNYTHIKLPQPSRPDDVVGLETSAIKISAQPRGRRCYHWGLCAEDQWMSNYNCLNTNRITESFHSHRHQGRKNKPISKELFRNKWRREPMHRFNLRPSTPAASAFVCCSRGTSRRLSNSLSNIRNASVRRNPDGTSKKINHPMCDPRGLFPQHVIPSTL